MAEIINLAVTKTSADIQDTDMLEGQTAAGGAGSSFKISRGDLIANKAPIDSPTFTGTPAAPTATAGTNTTQVATTAFVQNSKYVFYVNDYGAVGDSSGATTNGTNNATALDNCINAAISAGGGVVRLGTGIYRYTGVLNFTANNITIEGHGMGISTLFCDNTSNNNANLRIVGNNIHYRNFTLLGRKVFQGNQTGVALQGSNCSIAFVEVSNSCSFGIWVNNGSRNTVVNCIVHDSAADGIHVASTASQINVLNNTIYTCADDGIGIGYEGPANQINVIGNNIYQTSAGIAIMGYSSSGSTPDVHTINVENNNISTTWLAGIFLHVTQGSLENVNINGNTIRNAGSFAPTASVLMRGTGVAAGISVQAGITGASGSVFMKNISITNNNIFGARNMFINCGFVTTAAANDAQLLDFKINGNNCQSITAVGGAGSWGFGASGSSQSPNDALYPGFHVGNVDSNLMVHDNQIRGANTNVIRIASTNGGYISVKNNMGVAGNVATGTTFAFIVAPTSSSAFLIMSGNTHNPANGYATGITNIASGMTIIEKTPDQEWRNAQSGTTYTITQNDIKKTIALTNTAARAITMPSLALWPVGESFAIVLSDEANTAATGNITMTRAGSDTFLGGGTTNVMSTNGQTRRIYSNGTVWVPVVN